MRVPDVVAHAVMRAGDNIVCGVAVLNVLAHQEIVQLNKDGLNLRDDDILVVAGVPDQRFACASPREDLSGCPFGQRRESVPLRRNRRDTEKPRVRLHRRSPDPGLAF